MTTQEFAKTIRNKYPNGVASDGTSYADMNDNELARRIVEKYPAYKSQVELDSNMPTSELGKAYYDLGKGTTEAVNERATNIAEEFKKGSESKNPIQHSRSALHIAGEGAGLVSDVAFEGIKFLTPKFVEDLVGKGVEKVGQTEAAQAVMKKFSELKEKHPEAMKDIEAVINIASLVPEGKAVDAIGEGAAKATSQVSRITGEAIDASRATRIAKATEEVDSVVGKIIQGEKGDITKAKRALSTIDTTGVENYADLRTRISDGVEAIARKVDDRLEAAGESIGPLKAKDLVTETKVGSTAVKQNFVSDALDQLEELYTKTKDAPAQAAITNLKEKFTKEGLSLKELNDLARDYGREFKSKAFSKTGEALTSVNAQAFENTRKGIKSVVRGKVPDDVTKMLDGRMSEMLNTERLVGKMEEKVNALYQKVQKRGLLEKAGGALATGIDIATGGTVKGFIAKLLPSNVGLKVMNSIDLENALKANLKKLDRLMKISDDEALADEVVKLLKENAK